MNGHLPPFGSTGPRRLGWRQLRWALAAATVPLALWACNSHPLEQTPPAPEEQTDLIYEVNPVRKLDLLFMVDNSNSMAQEQDNLRKNFPDFMRELTNIKGGAPDMHIAVISSNVGAGQRMPAAECSPGGDRGAFQVKQGCGLNAATDGYYLKVDGTGKTNFDGGLPRLPEVFGCMAQLGVNGCGYEHQLLSMYFALDGKTNPETNKGFLRDDAYLGIVLISDEDDCSGPPTADFFNDPVPGQAGSLRCALKGHKCDGMDVPGAKFSTRLANCEPYVRNAAEQDTNSRLIDVQTFVDFVKNIKRGNVDRILVSSVIGWSDDPNKQYAIAEHPARQGGTELDLVPVCEDPATGQAAPGIRLNAFAKAFRNNTVHPICSSDLKKAMTEIGVKLRTILENTCITAPLYDTNDNTADGVQADCQVLDQVPVGDNKFREQAILPCGTGGGKTCWKLVSDPMCGSGFRTEVERESPAEPGTLQSIRCLTCPIGSTDPRCKR